VLLEELGVIPRKQTQFGKKGIKSVEDLLRFTPRSYQDFRFNTDIKDKNEISCLSGEVIRVRMPLATDKKKVMQAHIKLDNGALLVCTWLNLQWQAWKIESSQGKRVFVCGKVEYKPQYNSYSCMFPNVFEEEDVTSVRRIVPVYSKIEGMSTDYILKTLESAFRKNSIKEYLPNDLLSKRELPRIEDSLKELHFPTDDNKIKLAQKRLLYDDLLYFALTNEVSKSDVKAKAEINKIDVFCKLMKKFPFELTKAQKDVLYDIVNQIKKGDRLNGLLQGDVGCGKTVVAFMLSVLMAENGYQTAIMAPSKVLAKQHFEDLKEFLAGTDIKCAFYADVSKIKAKDKKEILEGLKTGDIKIVVGTSSLISDKMEYNNLALALIDEEHKFGVIQRQTLAKKGEEGVHTLSMSATPIPRTLALSLYDDSVQLFEINELPAGRKSTKNCLTNNWEATLSFVRKELREGNRAYVVCPAIEKSDLPIMSVEEVARIYTNFLTPLGFKCGVLTGKTPAKEITEIINSFENGDIHLLIATSVIEVGVNVKDATVMVIHNSERFGLAALHQLRGRVGRSDKQAYCIFFSDDTENKRLNVIKDTNNGFEIAKADLSQRSMGDLIGTKQSGENKYIDQILSYPELFEEAKEDAKDFLEVNGPLKAKELLENINTTILS